MGYDAFISYSHGGDRELAEALQAGLARFAKPWYRRRALNVFRDSTGLSANPGLWSAITEVMEDSEFFVVLCSPASAASPWVGREIDHWRATKPAQRILPVLTDGELLWDSNAARFDPQQSTAAHPALLEAFTEEPLYVDMRDVKSDGNLSLRNPGFQDKVADLAAPMHGKAKDELVGEDIRQHRRTLRFAWGAALAMLVLTIATAFGAVIAVRNAELAKQRAEEKVRIQGQLDAKKHELVALGVKLNERQVVLKTAQSQLDTANQSTAEAQSQAQSAGTDRDAARAQATRNRALADMSAKAAANLQLAARAATKEANDQRANATKAQGDAKKAQDDAVVAQGEARTARDDAKQAKGEATRARDDRDKAKHDKNVADAQAAQTKLSALAQDPKRLAGALDLSLLLGVESASVEPAPDAPLSAARSEFRPDTQGLKSVVDEAGHGLHGFLHFAPGTDPKTLDQMAVSSDGKYVAAVETSRAIQLGRATARLFVWNGEDPSHAVAIEASHNLSCVSDVRWILPGFLMTVENPLGCLNPQKLFRDDTTHVEYIGTRVRMWGFEGTKLVTPDGGLPLGVVQGEELPGYSLFGRSPLELSPDGHFLSISLYSGFQRPNDGRPFVFNVLLDTTTVLNPPLHLHTGIAEPASLVGQSTFSPNGRYAVGLDQVTSSMALWDLGVWVDGSAQNECLIPEDGCFHQVNLTDADGVHDGDIGAHLAFAPDRDGAAPDLSPTFAAASNGLDAVKFFDAASGRELPGSRRAIPIDGLAFNGSVAAVVVAAEGSVHLIDPHDPMTDRVIHVVTPAPGCTFYPTFSTGRTLLFLQRLCPVAADGAVSAASTLVVNVESGQFLREIAGAVSFSSPDDRFVVAQRQPNASSEDASVLFGFDIWDFKRGPTGDLIDSSTKTLAVTSPDGSTVVAVHPSLEGLSKPGIASVWHLGAGSVEQETLPGSLGAESLVFGPGHLLFGAGSMASGVVWDTSASFTSAGLTSEQLREKACDLAGRQLTKEEFGKYVGGDYRATCP